MACSLKNLICISCTFCSVFAKRLDMTLRKSVKREDMQTFYFRFLRKVKKSILREVYTERVMSRASLTIKNN